MPPTGHDSAIPYLTWISYTNHKREDFTYPEMTFLGVVCPLSKGRHFIDGGISFHDG